MGRIITINLICGITNKFLEIENKAYEVMIPHPRQD